MVRGRVQLSCRGRTYGNGGQRRDYVDRDGRLYSIVSNLHQGFRYGFDANGRLTQLTNFAEPAQGLWSQSYGYDALNRLTSANSAGLGNQGFQYDPNGNRTRHTRGGSVSDYTIAATSNRLTAITGTGARSYSYKATGQVSAITGAMGGNWIFRNGFQTSAAPTTTFSYDPFNRLSAITGPGISSGYKVAATGMRVEKSTGGQTTRFVYGMNGQLLYERNLGTNQRSHYLYLDGQPVGLVRNGTLHYVLPDHLGRPEVIVDQNQNQVWRATLSAFERRVIRDQIGGRPVPRCRDRLRVQRASRLRSGDRALSPVRSDRACGWVEYLCLCKWQSDQSIRSTRAEGLHAMRNVGDLGSGSC